MDRRGFLMAVTSATAVGAGCSAPFDAPEPTSFGPPTVETPDEGTYYYNFAAGGDPAVNVDVRVDPRSAPSDRAGVVLSVGPQSGWELTAFRVALLAPADPPPGEPPARVLLEVPDAGPYPPFSLRVTDEGYRVVELEGLAEAGLGDGTIPLRLAVVPRTPAESLSLRFAARCRSPEGRSTDASVTDRLSMPVTR